MGDLTENLNYLYGALWRLSFVSLFEKFFGDLTDDLHIYGLWRLWRLRLVSLFQKMFGDFTEDLHYIHGGYGD